MSISRRSFLGTLVGTGVVSYLPSLAIAKNKDDAFEHGVASGALDLLSGTNHLTTV